MTTTVPRKRVFYIVFFIVLVLAFFLGLAKAVPGFFSGTFPPIGKVEAFSFTNQDGQKITETAMQGKVSVVNYFFTTCKSVCPIMNNNLKVVYEKYQSNPDFKMFSFTSDPDRDSVPRLKRYSDSMHVSPTWTFLTGRKDSLYNAARHSFKIDDPKNFVTNVNDDFLHTQFVALINKKGEIVHIYDGIKPSEVAQLSDRIQKLLKESL
jgi:protein SCO1/2